MKNSTQLVAWSLLAGFTCCLNQSAYAQDAWRQLDPDNTLIIDSSKGRIVIEMRPEIAPKAVERIKLLSREKVYDGLQFHRVIAKFVAQTGNPNNRDGGTSKHPNLPPEMMFKIPYSKIGVWASQSSDGATGFIGSIPIQTLPLTDPIKSDQVPMRSWGAHCPGVAGMGRNEARDSANSELYFMLDASRRLDRDYTVFGRIVGGMDVLLKIQHGEPPKQPDVMLSVKVMADLPLDSRPKMQIATDAALAQIVAKMRQEKGADFSICDITIPSQFE
ncbi:peptidylprolyl isomerase [Undibacterium fentianense]|uniref:peptidylprolyl isomerase n=1 Tax=Undibacterium fentianense TaxID=2828728 RepID=A0A941E271_9BURK|nr:peptidylprolyl isomerase [Undibacterium fentianense]MBR7799882.1 peptidylprolyl isomerase [Undibacterium fentianense]